MIRLLIAINSNFSSRITWAFDRVSPSLRGQIKGIMTCVTSPQDRSVPPAGNVLAGGQERGGGGARILSSVTLTFEWIFLLRVTNQCARRTQSYNPRLYHIYIYRIILNRWIWVKNASKFIYRGWDFLSLLPFLLFLSFIIRYFAFLQIRARLWDEISLDIVSQSWFSSDRRIYL